MTAFAAIRTATPDKASLTARYAALHRQLDDGDRPGALVEWDGARREYDTWVSLVYLRFAQNTLDPSAIAAREYADLLGPEAADLEAAFKRRLLADPDRSGLESAAGRFRRMHLIGALLFLPYGVCVDRFQHEVYANPDATPAERYEMWRRLEALYMPWTDYGDLAFPASGGRWLGQGHIFTTPWQATINDMK